MQFIASSKKEFSETIDAILEANIYQEIAINYAIDKDPAKYPCIVSLELEEYTSDTRHFAFSACKYIYMEDLVTGYEYQDNLAELDKFDQQLSEYVKEMNTSGTIDKHITECKELEEKINNLEGKLF